MSVRIVRLGSPRLPGEGLRIGTVRRPPRGVPKNQHASGDWYDVWYPELAPSAALLRTARQAADEADWQRFRTRYRAEMTTPGTRRTLALLAALSLHTDLSVGCYCADETRCHRGVLRELLREAGADVVV
ncbi:DUF488 domain-containing protein [Immundisolibacter sp.]|uniref:DUF488 domain-containing protein n=1 Tax=Immundisolibacter sp. TaxID=1934948 RepID=UPI003562A4B1